MKTKTPLLFVPLFLVFFLAACAPQVTPEAIPVVPVMEEPAATDAPAPTEMVSPVAEEKPAEAVTVAPPAPANPGVDAMALIQEKLQGHHDLDRILNAKHTREEWNSTLDRMIKYGAIISEDEKKIIIDYLMSRQ